MTCSGLRARARAEGQKFCGECGSALAGGLHLVRRRRTCPAQKFCGECGTPLAHRRAALRRAEPRRRRPCAERRLVSVLFADLVGFTPRSRKTRDAEEVRELLVALLRRPRDGDRALRRHRREVHRRRGHGRLGHADRDRRTTPSERFAPRSTWSRRYRRSARRSVRPSFARAPACSPARRRSRSAPRARAWSRAISSTPPRGSSRRPSPEPSSSARRRGGRRKPRSSTRTRASHELKGKAEPSSSGRRSASSPARRGGERPRLEPPFVGRDRELRLVKELFHATAEERRRSSSRSSGIAGIGKSRLSWEFEKYIDGLAGDVWWHRGRCLSYGEGVAYWALAEMVRMRARDRRGRGDGDRRARSCAPPSRSTFPTRRSGAGSSRGSRTCSGSRKAPSGDQENLFAAWRIFFERLAETGPTVLVFEDMQWADARCSTSSSTCSSGRATSRSSCSRSRAPSSRTGARPGASGKRNFTSLFLEPLATEAMEELLTGPCPGSPTSCASRSCDARRVFRSTRSRPCACCSTAACSSEKATRTGRRERSRRSRCPRRCRH